MRFRKIVLPVALGLAAVLALPSSASAAAQCELIMPTKLVVDQKTEEMDFRLSVSCGSNGTTAASWSLTRGAEGGTLDFDSDDIAYRYFLMTWADNEGKGTWSLKPAGASRGDGSAVTQNSSSITVKYASRIAQSVTRSSSGALSWSLRAEQWSGNAHTYVGRPSTSIGLFHQTSSTAAWTYVKSVTTSSTGRASVSLSAPKSGNYRFLIAETPSVWKSYTSSVKGRV